VLREARAGRLEAVCRIANQASRSVKTLILKPSSLGDVIHALPVLRLLKRHSLANEIYWWIEAGLAPLLQDDPDLAGVIPFQRQRWGNPWHWDELWRSVAEIRSHRFDWVIDLQSLARSAAFAWLAGGELTIGLDDSREGARAIYDIAVARPSGGTHAVDWYLEALKPLGVPVATSFVWLPERPRVAQAVRDKWQPAAGPWLAVQPGARWENKRWPEEHFAQLVAELAREHSTLHFAVLGGESDRRLGESIAAAARGRGLNLAGCTSLPEMIEWIRLCDAMVTNDTGPMHVAAALGKPVVALFGPTDSRRTGPYGNRHVVLRHPLPCAPCMKDSCAFEKPIECLRAISPSMVATRVTELIARPQPPVSA
jgi:lipopolysaccharide heptosyltransferase I